MNHFNSLLSMATTSTTETFHRSAFVPKVLSEVASTGASDDITQLFNFITSLPPDTNVYAALIPYINAKAATSNPRWMSIVLVFMIFLQFMALVLGILILSYHLRNGSWWWFRIQNRLIKVDRTLWEGLGMASCAFMVLIEMMAQLYIDYHKAPVPGRILISWFKIPIVGYALWCIMWGCSSNHIESIWDPTFRRDRATAIPTWVVILLNSLFVAFSILILLVVPLVGIISHLMYTRIFNALRNVTGHLLVASKAPGANQLSLAHLQKILKPLSSFPERVDELAHEIRREVSFVEFIVLFLIVTYVSFVYLTYRQLQSLKKAQKVLSSGRNSEAKKVDYTFELRKLVIEAVLLLLMLISYQPLFIWTVTSSAKQLVSSKETAMLPELSVSFMSCIVSPVVGVCRVVSIRHLLFRKKNEEREREMRKTIGTDSNPSTTSDPFQLELLETGCQANSSDEDITNSSDVYSSHLEKSI